MRSAEELKTLVASTIFNRDGSPGLSIAEIRSIANQSLTIEVHKVVSSNIAALGYDELSETLEVVYSNGTHYRYAGVPKDLADLVLKAESTGKAVNGSIKGRYAYFRINEKIMESDAATK